MDLAWGFGTHMVWGGFLGGFGEESECTAARYNISSSPVQRWYSDGSTLVRRWYSVSSALVRRWFGVGTALVQRWWGAGPERITTPNQWVGNII